MNLLMHEDRVVAVMIDDVLNLVCRAGYIQKEKLQLVIETLRTISKNESPNEQKAINDIATILEGLLYEGRVIE